MLLITSLCLIIHSATKVGIYALFVLYIFTRPSGEKAARTHATSTHISLLACMRELTDNVRAWSYVGAEQRAPIYRLYVMCYVIGTIVTVSDTVTTITVNTLPCSADLKFEGSRPTGELGRWRAGHYAFKTHFTIFCYFDNSFK